QDAHNHTQNSHNHTQDSHNHTQNSHNHTQDSHNHTQDAHGHNINATFTSGTPSNLASVPQHNLLHDYVASGTAGAGTVSGGIDNAVIANTATNQATTATNQAQTATNIANTATNQATTATNIATTATNQNTGGGTAYFQPFIAVNYIIKY
ncbi:MAG: hypothetical protein EBW68_07240, partial [Actinobacteria bacterium]|nr:hypothetical protein [Actinomycetota bacterium]